MTDGIHDANWLDGQVQWALGNEEGVPSLNDLAFLLGSGASQPWEALTANAQVHEPSPPA